MVFVLLQLMIWLMNLLIQRREKQLSDVCAGLHTVHFSDGRDSTHFSGVKAQVDALDANVGRVVVHGLNPWVSCFDAALAGLRDVGIKGAERAGVVEERPRVLDNGCRVPGACTALSAGAGSAEGVNGQALHGSDPRLCGLCEFGPDFLPVVGAHHFSGVCAASSNLYSCAVFQRNITKSFPVCDGLLAYA